MNYYFNKISEEDIQEILFFINSKSNPEAFRPELPANRSAKLIWVNNAFLRQKMFNITEEANKNANWNLSINNIQTLQYSEYTENDEYGWHIDKHDMPYSDGKVRKISFSIFLNNDYVGGEFDIEVYGPNSKKRYITIDNFDDGNIVFFHSDKWHRVRPVKEGIKKSLVGWVLGPSLK
jgi:PKHD-type hydroxylase